MKKKNSTINSFNLAFLDIMFCGFGAVVLLVLIINSHIVSDNKIKNEELRIQVEQLEDETKSAAIKHNKMQKLLETNYQQAQEIEDKLTKTDNTLQSIDKKNSGNSSKTQALKKQIKELQENIKVIEKRNIQQKKNIEISQKQSGNKVRQYEGDGHRQYLTGLKLGGKRVLILLDNSASMLDETIVNIIAKRNLSNSVKKSARKWRQAVESVKWMVANLPKSSQFLIASFNKETQSLADNQAYQWIKTSDQAHMNAMFKRLQQLVPENGTNLSKAFASILKLKQKPDNIILISQP
ncbi:MAG: hypothetical protein KZQ70_11000 [gamma proteobacterium symbiont of Lucinoma myriamae]|nr:hypothetical protein [gamma proteobacterium symbiont of Lucinoma myriamae]MCU7819413.1 hypothetical protein [gamma proteobacterium symbiont of Lucinoma myriamae]MCU7832967.1 hypothetical protein [gamma proteobacterium symbiont of Lucinoma myriamae]